MERETARESRKESRKEVHSQMMNRGLRSAAIFGTAGVLGHLLLTKTWPVYSRHTLPWKVLGMLMIPTAAFFTVSHDQLIS